MMVAAYHKHTDIVVRLLECKETDPNVRSAPKTRQSTALMVAACIGCLDVVNCLVACETIELNKLDKVKNTKKEICFLCVVHWVSGFYCTVHVGEYYKFGINCEKKIVLGWTYCIDVCSK